jgi:hypothetical protein
MVVKVHKRYLLPIEFNYAMSLPIFVFGEPHLDVAIELSEDRRDILPFKVLREVTDIQTIDHLDI